MHAACQFPGLAEHKRLHDKMTQDTLALQAKAAQQPGVAGREVLQFLKTWWLDHICGADKDYMPFQRPPERKA